MGGGGAVVLRGEAGSEVTCGLKDGNGDNMVSFVRDGEEGSEFVRFVAGVVGSTVSISVGLAPPRGDGEDGSDVMSDFREDYLLDEVLASAFLYDTE